MSTAALLRTDGYVGAAERMNVGKGWAPDEQPWARVRGAGEPDRGMEGTGYLQCPFCGQFSAKRSYGDEAADTGRVELYCTNEICQAREIVVLVMKDSYQAHTRADVRLLRALDTNTTEFAVDDVPPPVRYLGDLIDADSEALTPRRQNTGDVRAAAHGVGERIDVDRS